MAPGEVAEWLNAPHSKCGIGASLSGVRIPPSPPRSRALRMSVLREVLRVLIFADWGCAVVLLVMVVRLAFLRAGELPEWRGLLTLRRLLASELSKEFHAYNRQLVRLMLALALVLAVGAFLFWLDILFFGAPGS